jgi:hypothetical protein
MVTKEFVLRYLIICIAVLIYFIITVRYFLVLRRSVIFDGGLKTFHLIMIWIIPFIWIFILKSLTKPTPGSYEAKKKTNSKPFSDNDDDALKASEMGY